MTRLLVYEPALRRIEDQIADLKPQLRLLVLAQDGTITLDGEELSSEDAQPDIAWGSWESFAGPSGRNLVGAMMKSRQLAWMQSPAAGFDNPMFAQVVEKGARLTSSHGQAVGMADYVLAGVLDHFQRWPAKRAAQAEGVWRRSPLREVTGTTWLIYGFGAIGQGVAQRARAFGAKIIGVRRDQTPHPLADELVTLQHAKARLPEADVVVLALPLSPATQHLVNADFLAAMKPRSVLVNVGRGGLVDEAALLRALDAGTPEHAVLDVFEQEPLPEGNPIYAHPAVTMTPHCSGIGETAAERNDALFVENLRRFLKGEPLLHEERREDVLADG